MLMSLSILILSGLLLGKISSLLKLPALLGYLIAGIITGPYALGLMDSKILLISEDLRRAALIIILIRGGLSLDIKDLKKAGRPAFFLSFIPAVFEIAGAAVIFPLFFRISVTDAVLLGSVLAAVSPAVVVPRMTDLIERKMGTDKLIPQTILAGASVDDITVIVIFTSVLSLVKSGTFSPFTFLRIPTSVISGIAAGIITGKLLLFLFKKIHIRDTGKLLIILSVSFLLVSAEPYFKGNFAFSGLLSSLVLGVVIRSVNFPLSERLSGKFSKIWYISEVILFTLVGVTVNLNYVHASGIPAVAAISLCLIFRTSGVWLSLAGTSLNLREKIFTAVSYIPKATVQAAIGAIPLAEGLSSGNLILSCAVVSILFTAPLGAVLMDSLKYRLLKKE